MAQDETELSTTDFSAKNFQQGYFVHLLNKPPAGLGDE